MRIALLLGSYLISADDGVARVWIGNVGYGPDEVLPVLAAPVSSAPITARDFVRHSMQELVGQNEKAWPALARKFLG